MTVLQTGESIIVLVAECLAGFDSHASKVYVGDRVEGAGVSFIGAAEVGPGVDGLAGDRDPGCG
jgi:hypothetical protein